MNARSCSKKDQIKLTWSMLAAWTRYRFACAFMPHEKPDLWRVHMPWSDRDPKLNRLADEVIGTTIAWGEVGRPFARFATACYYAVHYALAPIRVVTNLRAQKNPTS
jgi:hypothetical protein